MTNSSGENDGYLLFRHCSALASCSAALEYNWPAIPGDNFVILTKSPQPVILAGEAGKNRRERFFASVASPKGAYQG